MISCFHYSRNCTMRAPFQAVSRTAIIVWRFSLTCLKVVVGAVALVAVLMLLGNWVFHTQRDIPYRALSLVAPDCQEDAKAGWNVLALSDNKQIPNDELSAIDKKGSKWRAKFACAIQHHAVPDYKTDDGKVRSLDYDLAFVEFQEDGKPYVLRRPCEPKNEKCIDEGYGPVKLDKTSQLDVLLAHLKTSEYRHYVLVFIHGWRNDASIGNGNVADLRLYAAHVARFIEDRAALDPNAPKYHLTAVYIGWRGARTDENWLHQKLGSVGSWIGAFSAVGTLFDRKPVSEAIAPSVLTALRDVENQLGIANEIPDVNYVPNNPNKMIVFGHSLGGNLLITALGDDLVKRVDQHTPGKYMQPVLGDLVVLINPAAEAAKWIQVQKALWRKLALIFADRRPGDEYVAAHKFFRQDQAPIIVSATAARDWPPGGNTEVDCHRPNAVDLRKESANKAVSKEGFEYDWATYDLFPFFKGDFRPLSDTLKRLALQRDPHDACDDTPVSTIRRIATAPVHGLSLFLRVFPFMNTNPEESRTLGHVDPPRLPVGNIRNFSARPFGTTHELTGLDPAVDHSIRTQRKRDPDNIREIPLKYNQVILEPAACPTAKSWLLRARQKAISPNSPFGLNWDSQDAPDAPALRFRHGFRSADISPITRANDPFWNVRAFDTALALHDGYRLSSFICAMNQLVLDDPGGIASPRISAKAEGPSKN
jgi:hypothetical protein